jgi:hypothetical protein
MRERPLLAGPAACRSPSAGEQRLSDPKGGRRTWQFRRHPSPSAARIIRLGTGLIAGAPSANPRPSLVMVPTPSPARRTRSSPESAQRTSAVMRAPSVQSGSSPASFTTTARPSPSHSIGKRTRRPAGRPTSTRSGRTPPRSTENAALAAAEAQVPVVHPLRSPFRPATVGLISGSWGTCSALIPDKF